VTATKTRTLVEIARFPPPTGSWTLRIGFVVRRWQALGRKCLLMNVNRDRRSHEVEYTNVRGPFDFVFKVLKVAAKGHILHTHTNGKGIKGTLLALTAQLIGLVFGRRTVLTFHAGLQQEYFPKTGRLWLDSLMWLTFKTPRYIICNSDRMKQRIVEDYGVPEDKVFAIPAFCGAYMETEPGELSPAVNSFAQQHDPLLVSYVFFFHPEFTVDLMIETVKRLRAEYPNLGLIIMGSKQYAENYTPLIEELNLTDHVLLSGNLPREEFLAVLKRGHAYLRTPMGDGVAASVLEALTLGTPVVAADNGTRPESCLLYREGDLDEMVDRLRYVIENRNRVAERITAPDADDTIEKEVEVLLSV